MLALGTVVAVKQQLATPTSTTSSTSSTTTSTLPPAPLAVGTMTLSLTEPAAGGLGARTIPTVVRYPAVGTASASDVPGAIPRLSGGPYPLVIFSQGFALAPEAYALLLHAWAAAGYVVADPEYPLTSPSAPGGPVRTDIVHHPADLSFVITSLLNENVLTGNALSGLIDGSQIGVIGHSDGGDVSLASVANSCCRDARIKAAVILSGAELSWFKGTYFSAPTVPLLVVQGTDDGQLNAVYCSAQIYNQDHQVKFYLSMLGESHVSAYLPPGPAQNVVAEVSIDFLNAYLRHATASVHSMRLAGNVAGLASLTSPPTIAPTSGVCADAPTG